MSSDSAKPGKKLVFARRNERDFTNRARKSPLPRKKLATFPAKAPQVSVSTRKIKENLMMPVGSEEGAESTPLKLRYVIFFGDVQFFASLLFLACCFLILVINGESVVAFFALACAIYHMIFGILAVCVGRDAATFRACIPFCIGAGALGLVLMVIFIVSDFTFWHHYNTTLCRYCWSEETAIYDPQCEKKECQHLDAVHFSVAVFAVIFAVLDVMVSFLFCRYLWTFWAQKDLGSRRRRLRRRLSGFSVNTATP